MRAFLLCAVMLAARPAFADEISFARDIAPVLKTNCAAACHLTGEEPGHLKLYPGAAYKSLVGVPSEQSPLVRVAPGAPDKSYLVHKLDGTQIKAGGQGARMPFGGDPLPPDILTKISRWIEQGAPNN